MLWSWNQNLSVLFFSYFSQLAPVAQKANDAIHWINLYPLDTQLFPCYLTARKCSGLSLPLTLDVCLCLSMKICAQRIAGRSKQARRASPLLVLRPMVPCALSPVLAFRGHLGVKIKRLRWTLSWSIARIWSFIICFFPVPSGAPRQPSARVVNSSAIVVRWSPPLQKDQAGRLEGYVVYYLKVDDLGNQLNPRPNLQIDHTARGDLVWLFMLLYIVRTVRLLIY